MDNRPVRKMKVLVACECSGRVRDAFIKLGHDAISCDVKPSEVPGPHLQCDIRDVIGSDWDLMIAHPVCKRLANSGVRWLHERNLWEELGEAVAFYNVFRNATHIPLRAIENPIMHKYARERIGNIERQIVQPWWFGDEAFKATGFELYGLPDLVPTNKLRPPEKSTEEHKAWSAIHREPPGPQREANRSRTFQGIAKAMAEQWGGRVTGCPECGSEAVIHLSSLDKRLCADCKHKWVWRLKPGQWSLAGDKRGL